MKRKVEKVKTINMSVPLNEDEYYKVKEICLKEDVSFVKLVKKLLKKYKVK